MLSASSLRGVDKALDYVVTHATLLRGLDMCFGHKSVVVAGDLYQLPAVERWQYEDQVYKCTRWSQFRYVELTEIMRTDADEYAFADMLSRARLGWEHLTAADWQMLESRVCANHCQECVPFDDVMMIRRPGGTTRADDVAVPQRVEHCPCGLGADGGALTECVLAARRAKVEQLNDAYAAQLANAGVATTVVHAVDSDAAGHIVQQAQVRDNISARLSALPSSLTLHVGQLVMLTVNKRRTHAGFVNSAVGIVVSMAPEPVPTEIVVRLLDEPEGTAPVRVRRLPQTVRVHGGEYTRLMFPIVPAFALTIHRVQGATLTGDVHILLNAEIFAAGQAYVALSRVERLEQLHLWGLHREALKGNPVVDDEYRRLEGSRLDAAYLAAAPRRQRVRALIPLA